jgi:hypothetical protein
MLSRSNSPSRWRLLLAMALAAAAVATASELGHLQWTSGRPSGLRGRGVPFDAQAVAYWRESGFTLWAGSISIWSAPRLISQESFVWGGGGASFFGVDTSLGGPGDADTAGRWLPRLAIGTPSTIGPAMPGLAGAFCLMLPLWPLTALLAAATGWSYSRHRRRRPGSCARCGYDRAGLGSRPCPECGGTDIIQSGRAMAVPAVASDGQPKA